MDQVTIAILSVSFIAYIYFENKYCSRIGKEIGREIVKARKGR